MSFQKTGDLDDLKEAAALFEQVVSLSIGEMEKDVRGEACLFLYRIHDGDINPDFADAGQAWRYLKMGAEAEHPSLQSLLARRYHHGEKGTQTNKDEAVKWYKKVGMMLGCVIWSGVGAIIIDEDIPWSVFSGDFSSIVADTYGHLIFGAIFGVILGTKLISGLSSDQAD